MHNVYVHVMDATVTYEAVRPGVYKPSPYEGTQVRLFTLPAGEVPLLDLFRRVRALSGNAWMIEGGRPLRLSDATPNWRTALFAHIEDDLVDEDPPDSGSDRVYPAGYCVQVGTDGAVTVKRGRKKATVIGHVRPAGKRWQASNLLSHTPGPVVLGLHATRFAAVMALLRPEAS